MAFDMDKLTAAAAGAVDRLDTAVDLIRDVNESAPARDVTARVRRGTGRSITAAKKGLAEVRRRARLLEGEAAAGRSRGTEQTKTNGPQERSCRPFCVSC